MSDSEQGTPKIGLQQRDYSGDRVEQTSMGGIPPPPVPPNMSFQQAQPPKKKKGCLGTCLIVFVILLLIAGGGLWFGYGKLKESGILEDFKSSIQQIEELTTEELNFDDELDPSPTQEELAQETGSEDPLQLGMREALTEILTEKINTEYPMLEQGQFISLTLKDKSTLSGQLAYANQDKVSIITKENGKQDIPLGQLHGSSRIQVDATYRAQFIEQRVRKKMEEQ